jgi:hypothetical protein
MGTDTPLGNPLFARVDASLGSGARVVNILTFPHREGAESLSGRLLASRPASADYINGDAVLQSRWLLRVVGECILDLPGARGAGPAGLENSGE